jgi:hypothetical protein
MKKDFVVENDSCLYIIGGKHESFVFQANNIVKVCNISIDECSMLICNNIDFIRINKHVIINTKFFRQLNKGREIVMKNGTIFKVSRRCVSLFK